MLAQWLHFKIYLYYFLLELMSQSYCSVFALEANKYD